jgi:hypothetical protein
LHPNLNFHKINKTTLIPNSMADILLNRTDYLTALA